MRSVSVVGGRGDAPPSQHCDCGAVPRFDSLCLRPLAVPRMEHTAESAFPFQRVKRNLNQKQQLTSCVCFRFLSPCSRMSSDTFWSDACLYAQNRPLQARLDALYASCGVTVRRPPLLPLGACSAHACVAVFLVCM